MRVLGQNGRAAAKALLGACEAEPGFSLLLSQEVERFQLCPDSGKVQAINTADYRSAVVVIVQHMQVCMTALVL